MISAVDNNNGQQCATMDNNGQQRTTIDNNGQQWTTIRGAACISDAVFTETCKKSKLPVFIHYKIVDKKFHF